MKTLMALAFMAILAACATVPIEGLYTEIDPSNWEVGYQKDDGPGRGYIREFVPRGESIESWSKLISIEFAEGETRSAEDFVLEFQEKRKQQCPGTQFSVLDQGEHSITYSFSFPPCMGHDAQSEISRVYEGNDGLHRLSYAEKTEQLSQATIEAWEAEFDKSYVVKGPNKEPIRLNITSH